MDDTVDECNPPRSPPLIQLGPRVGAHPSQDYSIDTHKPSTSSLASTLDSMFNQIRRNLTQRQPRQVTFGDLRRLRTHFIPATGQAPLRHTSFLVPVSCFYEDVSHDVEELVASVMSSRHSLAPSNRMSQYTVRILIDPHQRALFTVLFRGHLARANPPFTNIISMWLHLDAYRTNKTLAVSAPALTGNTMTRSTSTLTRASQPHRRTTTSPPLHAPAYLSFAQ